MCTEQWLVMKPMNHTARPSLPLVVNPDSWLKRVEGNRYVRRVDYKGAVKLDKHKYYVGRDWAGQYVSLEIDAAKAEVVVVEAKKLAQVKRLPLKGLHRAEMSFEDYAKVILQEARSEWRRVMLRTMLARNNQLAA